MRKLCLCITAQILLHHFLCMLSTAPQKTLRHIFPGNCRRTKRFSAANIHNLIISPAFLRQFPNRSRIAQENDTCGPLEQGLLTACGVRLTLGNHDLHWLTDGCKARLRRAPAAGQRSRVIHKHVSHLIDRPSHLRETARPLSRLRGCCTAAVLLPHTQRNCVPA